MTQFVCELEKKGGADPWRELYGQLGNIVGIDDCGIL